ncbi:hypothetical protein C1A40_13325 [Tamlana carrageenivorans]|uniref:Uncharacterized protein n=1 Tax=Pseudotamlana carrageenivorans TaxID=2069432 RepID=A0A2I7SKI9_9FLAO|nr:hypothetical protein C1A40_13325 [Tamlana carrageenivorans]
MRSIKKANTKAFLANSVFYRTTIEILILFNEKYLLSFLLIKVLGLNLEHIFKLKGQSGK